MSDHRPLIHKLNKIFFEDPSFDTNILSEIRGNRFYLTLNRPKRFNAFTSDMYTSFKLLIKYAN